MVNIKRKQIAFNLDDPLQRQLYDYACKYKNFSFYGKTLLQKDMSGWGNVDASTIEDVVVEVNSEVVKGFI